MDETTDLLHRLLEVTTWRAFDVDAQGRILAGYDGSGTVQLVELRPRDDELGLAQADLGRPSAGDVVLLAA